MCVHVTIKTNSSNTHASLTKLRPPYLRCIHNDGSLPNKTRVLPRIAPNDFKYSAVQLGILKSSTEEAFRRDRSLNISIYGCSPVPRLTELHRNTLCVPATNRRLRSKFWCIFLNTKELWYVQTYFVLTSVYGHTDEFHGMKVHINFMIDLHFYLTTNDKIPTWQLYQR
jgi:hypothetical protein